MADISLGEGRIEGAPPRLTRLVRGLADAFAAESDRRILWLPVFFGSGIALYFALTVEPPLWLGPAVAGVAGAAAWLMRRRRLWRNAAFCVAIGAAGLALITATARQRAAPMLDHRVGPVSFTGRVIDIDTLERGWRIIVAPDAVMAAVPGLDPAQQPHRLRIHITAASDLLSPGDRVSLKAMLYPVPGQPLPGAHDLQRDLYFAEIGGVGYSLGPAHRLADAEDARPPGGWRLWLLHLRTEVTRRITAVLPGSTGGVAAALIAGKRGAIDESVIEAFRNSGLSHLLAIAGLHLGLVGAFVFFAVRGGLALVPPIALRWPIKKIAAGATLIVLFCYLMLSGAAIPTERAFVMNGIVFAAILIDRLRLSMRICAVAAGVVLLFAPESLAGVSFQMSFGAVVALLAVYETWGQQLGRLLRRGSPGRKALGYCLGVVVTTVVVTLGTDPFSIYHFHRIIFYSPLANVIAVPISALWTLPWGVVSCLLMPFGLERLALVPMEWGIDATIWVASHVSTIPGNVWPTPRLPMGGLAIVAFGGLWLCLWRGKWRRWGWVGIAAGLATMFMTRPPDIVIADFGRFVAARAASGDYYVLGGNDERIAKSLFAEETGAELLPWPAPGAASDNLSCDADACRYARRGKSVAIVTDDKGVPSGCDAADAIVSQVPAGFACRKLIPVVDRIDNWWRGAVALWLDAGGITVAGANDSRGDRPWVPHPVAAKKAPEPADEAHRLLVPQQRPAAPEKGDGKPDNEQPR
ncbi:MAG TPA: ComEC/Rec2 family competence protein [Stellaceae bacterium]|nr:ComEC/Rec2 family competence protein [Stellaceae bacterium]